MLITALQNLRNREEPEEPKPEEPKPEQPKPGKLPNTGGEQPKVNQLPKTGETQSALPLMGVIMILGGMIVSLRKRVK